MALVIVSNVAYQICAKSVPQGMNAFASLTVTYLVGASTLSWERMGTCFRNTGR